MARLRAAMTALLAGAAMLVAAAVPASAQQTRVGPGGTGTSTLTGLAAGTPYLGQSLISPGGSLTSFSFNISRIDTAGNAVFGIAPLTGTTVGTPLYVSNPFAVTTGVNTISGLNIATQSGQSYFAYFSVYQVATPVNATFATYNPGTYAGGGLYYSNSDTSITGQSLNARFASSDTAFTAAFVPEPASWALMTLGFGMVGGTLRRRRRTLPEAGAARLAAA